MHVHFCESCQLHFHIYWWVLLAGFNCLIDPVCKLWDSSVDAGFHGVGASQTPRRDSLQDVPVLCVTNQRTPAVTLRGKNISDKYTRKYGECICAQGNWTGKYPQSWTNKMVYGIKPFKWSTSVWKSFACIYYLKQWLNNNFSVVC